MSNNQIKVVQATTLSEVAVLFPKYKDRKALAITAGLNIKTLVEYLNGAAPKIYITDRIILTANASIEKQ